MLKNPKNIAFAKQIANVLCIVSQPFCLASTSNRIRNSFTDEIFENYFLPNLNKGRFYKIYFGRIVKSGNYSKRTLNAEDILTGQKFSFSLTDLPNDKADNVGYLLEGLKRYFINTKTYGNSYKINYLGTVGRDLILEVDMPSFDQYKNIAWDNVNKKIVYGSGWSFLGGGVQFPNVMTFTLKELFEVGRINLEVARKKASGEFVPKEKQQTETKIPSTTNGILAIALAVASFFLMG